MFARRTLLAACTGLALVSCSKKPVAEATEAPAPAATAADQATDAPRVVDRPIQRYRLDASIENLSDMLDAVGKLSGWLPTEDPINPRADLDAAMLSGGFGPGFLGNLDLSGLHAAVFEYPHEGQPATAADNRFAGVLAVTDARKVIENMPASMRPQPLGGGLWEVAAEDVRILMREQAKWLELGMRNEDLDRASELPGTVGKGRRIRLAASNIPADDLDPSALLGLDRSTKLARQLSEVVQNVETIRVELDLGTDRDFQLFGAIEAPFEKLGLDPLGPARTAATPLEGRLPADPVLVATLSFADPGLLHKVLEREVPMEEIEAQVPEPLADLAKRALTHVHGTLDQVTDDVVAAIYLTAKGTAAVVLAAGVKDDAKASAAVRGMNEVIHDALKAQMRLEGSSGPDKMSVTFKPDGLKFTGASADHFVISLPGRVADDAAVAAPFLAGKKKLEVVSFVGGGTAVVAIGAGSRKIAGEIARNIAKPGKSTLASDPGLRAVRTGLEGCQLCITGDILEILRLRFLSLKATEGEKATKKEIGRALGRISKLRMDGAPGFGVTVAKGKASGALAIPRDVLFAPRKDAQAVIELVELADRDGRPEPQEL